MRQIATLPEEPARHFIDYLATLSIAATALPEPGGVGVWVCDEDRVAQARDELRQFLASPSDPRYLRAREAARDLRRREQAEEDDYRRTQSDAEDQLEQAKRPRRRTGPRPLTLVLMGLCVLVTTATNLGDKDHSLTRTLLISTQPPDADPHHVGLVEVRSAEVWRLVTPIFLHFKLAFDDFGVLHLLLNLFLFLPLAGQIESSRGTPRLAALVLAVAVASNLTQYYLGGSTIEGFRPVVRGSYYFGGLSGVVYGLFGYVWFRGRLEPSSGLKVSTAVTVLLLAWLLLGPLMDSKVSIATGAHFGGLLAGALIGVAPALWRRPPRDDPQAPAEEESEP